MEWPLLRDPLIRGQFAQNVDKRSDDTSLWPPMEPKELRSRFAVPMNSE